MQKSSSILILSVAVALFLGMLVAAGCGGGGPVNNSSGQATPSAEFTQLLPAAQRSALRVGASKCATCHATNHTSWTQTRHAQAKVDCESCHGPGSAHVAAPSKANILNGTDSVNSVVCGQCHSAIHNDFLSSKHAEIVEDPVNTGSNNCLRCHSAEFRALNVDSPLSHGKSPADVNTAIIGLTTAQLQTFVTTASGGGGATHTSATCVTCHDPHQNTGNLPSNGEEHYLRRVTSSQDASGVGPNVPVATYSTFNHLCGSCHNNRGGDPSDTGLTKNTTRPATHEGPEFNMLIGRGGSEDTAGPPVRSSTHAQAPDQCVHCHMPDSRHTFTVSLDTSCAPCHTPTDAAARESAVQGEIQNGLVALRTRLSNWAQLTFGDPTAWDYTSNSTVAPKDQSKIPIEVKRARHNYYFILLDRSLGVHNTPYTRYLLNYANTGLTNKGIKSVSRAVLSRQEAISILNEDIRKVRHGNSESGM